MRVLLMLLLVCSAAWAELPPHSQRQIPLQATRNTRDLGGVPVAGGVIRPGLVYRSGALCFLTPTDVTRMRALGLRTIVDLRNDIEIQRDGPDRPALTAGVRVVRLPMSNSRGIRAEAYRYLIRENDRAIRTFFELLSTAEAYPLLFHCSAGKDRTGILTSLLLMSLGASREDILADYMQSMKNSKGLIVHESWLEEVFLAVASAGGIQPFLAKRGITEEHITRIQEHLRLPGRHR